MAERAYVGLNKVHQILHDAGQDSKFLRVICDIVRFVGSSLGVVDPCYVGLANAIWMNTCRCTFSLHISVSGNVMSTSRSILPVLHTDCTSGNEWRGSRIPRA
jgi:hypothetical protein